MCGISLWELVDATRKKTALLECELDVSTTVDTSSTTPQCLDLYTHVITVERQGRISHHMNFFASILGFIV